MVSVIIPAYRAAGYIAETLRSVFDQTHAALEVILVNDGSPDTRQLLAAIGPWRARLRYLEQENAGAAAARNAGLEAATGEYVAFLDADDRWHPRFLERQVAYLRQHPECDLVYADALITGDTPLAGRTFMSTAPSRGEVSFTALLAQQCTVLTSSVVARRAAVDAAGRFDAGIRRGQDFDLWLRMAHRGCRMAYQREPLVLRQVLADGLSADPITELERVVAVLQGIRAKLPLDRTHAALVGRRVAHLSGALELECGKRDLRLGRFAAAREHFGRAVALSPTWKVRVVLAAMSLAPRIFQRAYMRLRPATAAEHLALGGFNRG